MKNLAKKRRLLLVLALLMVFTLVVTSCAPKADKDPVDNPPKTNEPVYGGNLRLISGTSPAVLGYPSEMSPGDDLFAQPYLEPMIEFVDLEDGSGGWGGVLAEDWKTDPENKTITFYLRKGVQFHDGTPFNAEAVQWNFQLRLDTNSLAAASLIEKFEIVDEYTFRIYVKTVDSLLWQTWGRNRIISPTAFEKAGNGDIEKSKEWARQNAVGTGPFKLAHYERDAIIKYEKNDNYWRKGYPYLDAMETRIVADPSTAAAMMESGQADYWLSPSTLEHKRLVEELKFTEYRSDWGMVWALLPDSVDPDSPFADKRVREAVEYAIDKEAIALMIGHGYITGMKQLAPPYEIGYDPNYNPRPYNPEKAKQLLAEAGYPNGFETTIITSSTPRTRDTLTAIQGYLGAVGITVKPDIADAARYASAVFMDGFDGMALTAHGADSTGRSIITHFGPAPRTFRTGDIYKTPEYLEATNKMLTSYDAEEFKAATAQAYKQASEDAMVIPVLGDFWLHTAQPYVRTETKASFVWSSFHDYWIEEQ